MDSHDNIPKDLPKIVRGRFFAIGVVVVILFGGMFLFRYHAVPRMKMSWPAMRSSIRPRRRWRML